MDLRDKTFVEKVNLMIALVQEVLRSIQQALMLQEEMRHQLEVLALMMQVMHREELAEGEQPELPAPSANAVAEPLAAAQVIPARGAAEHNAQNATQNIAGADRNTQGGDRPHFNHNWNRYRPYGRGGRWEGYGWRGGYY